MQRAFREGLIRIVHIAIGLRRGFARHELSEYAF
jgi:hypothetical protein